MLARLRQFALLTACAHAVGYLCAQELSPSNDWRARLGPSGEPWGAEDPAAEDDVPRIPEPMVFDLVRPLGARRGEFEINVLGIAPLRRARFDPVDEIPDALGLQGERFEWAPEVEWAIRDNFALEFELPFEEDRLAAYKGAAQVTFGRAFQDAFIHGAQVILQYDRQPVTWLPTFLYIAGVRFNETYSALAMLGLRANTNAPDPGERIEQIVNLSLFADFCETGTIGLESNYAQAMTGAAAWMLMPQLHWEITDHFMIQAGAGARFTEEETIPEAAFRIIRTW